MDDIRNFKEVFFDVYCPQCKYKDVEEIEDPCNECLTYPANENSHKPIKFEEAKRG